MNLEKQIEERMKKVHAHFYPKGDWEKFLCNPSKDLGKYVMTLCKLMIHDSDESGYGSINISDSDLMDLHNYDLKDFV